MTRELIGNIIRFFLLFVVQGLLLSNVDLIGGRAQVFLYVLFIIMLPFRISSMAAMGLAFLMGLAVDTFYDSAGLHASAAVLTAFVRPYFVRLFTPRDDYEVNDRPGISKMGLPWFLRFAAALTLIHCFWVFLLEAFDLSSIGDVLVKTLASTAITLLVMVIVTYLFSTKKSDR